MFAKGAGDGAGVGILGRPLSDVEGSSSVRPISRLLVTVAVAALAGFSVAPAVSAAPTARASGASASINAIPSDCTVTKPDLATTHLTCTARPAGQKWRLVVLCAVIGGWGSIYADGTIVTGNGTSTAVCTEVVGYRASYFEEVS
jgi:hypothetical protein